MNYLAVDLEMNQPSGKIIQIGFAIDGEDGKIYKSIFYVNPEETLNPFITTLTGITQEKVDDALTLNKMWGIICDVYLPEVSIEKTGRFMNPLTWGGGDIEEIFKQLGHEKGRAHFGRRWIDVKTLYVSWRMAKGDSIQSGLAKSMTRVGLTFEGKKHDAGDDALNTIRMYKRLLEEFK